jgi:hypothetical protein
VAAEEAHQQLAQLQQLWPAQALRGFGVEEELGLLFVLVSVRFCPFYQSIRAGRTAFAASLLVTLFAPEPGLFVDCPSFPGIKSSKSSQSNEVSFFSSIVISILLLSLWAQPKLATCKSAFFKTFHFIFLFDATCFGSFFLSKI